MRTLIVISVRRTPRVIGACLTLLLLAASALHAQTDARIAARLDAETSRQIALVIDAARNERLPVEPLVQKALEGASKRAPGTAIVRAVRDLSDRLQQSRQILGAQAPDGDVVAGAHALRSGLQPAALRLLRDRRGRTPLMASVGAFLELRGMNVTADTAAAAVVALRDAGVSPDQIAEFQREVAREIAVGGQPAMAAAVATELMAGDGAFNGGRNELANSGGLAPTSGGMPNAAGGPRPKRKP